MRKEKILLMMPFFVLACQPKADLEALKVSVSETEAAFARMAADSGMAKAFYHFADEDAVLMRGNRIISGREEIRVSVERSQVPGARLEWSPSFVDVAKAGDLAYTWGDFTYIYPDTAGQIQSINGIFHTVWKRQEDGSWRYVYD